MFLVQVQYIGIDGFEEPVCVTHDGTESGKGLLVGGAIKTWEPDQIMRLVDRLVNNPKIGAIEITRIVREKTPAPSEKIQPPPPEPKKLSGMPLLFANVLANYFKRFGDRNQTNESLVECAFGLMYGDEDSWQMMESQKAIVERLPPTFENLREQCGYLAELMDAHTDAFTDIPPL